MKVKLIHNGTELLAVDLDPNIEYIIGRDDNCEIQLLDPKVSRKHAKLFCGEDGSWHVALISQSGDLVLNGVDTKHSPLQHQDQLQVHHYHIVFSGESNNNLDASDQHPKSSSQDQNKPLFGEEIEGQDSAPDQQVFDNETTAGGNQVIENFLRVRYGEQAEELLKIDGNHWVLGRSDTNEIQLKDVKASRKHLVIRFDGKKYLAKDLGSSNGSSLNMNRMEAGKEYELNSGDEIQVGTTRITFEQRNLMFEEQIARLPVQVHQHPMIQMQGGEMSPVSNMPMIANQKGGELGFIIPENFATPAEQQKKKVFYAIITALVLVAVYGATTKDTGTKNSASTVIEKKSPYEELSSQQQTFVDNSFQSAHRFFSLDQWDLATAEIDKIHRFLPKGHSDPNKPQILHSMEMKTIADSASATLRDQQVLEQQQIQKAEFETKINKVLIDCEAKSASFSETQARQCLDFVFTNMPGNAQAQGIISSIQNREVQKRQKRKLAQDQQVQINRGKNLYTKAKRIEKSGDILAAIDAYEDHISSSYQDPSRLKSKSRGQVSYLSKKIGSEIERLRKKLEGHFESQEYKEAIYVADKILELQSNNANASEKRGLSQTQLNQKLREDYQDSVFREAHGEIDEAKKIWKRVIIKDIKGGEYYKKATIKLQKHGELQ